MKIGSFEINIVTSGYFALDGGAMFGVVPKTLWERKIKADEKNRIRLATRNLLLSSGSRNILIDTGMGEKWTEKEKAIYAIEEDAPTLKKSLKQLDKTPDDITDVFITHLHFDHTGGSTVYENDKLVPAFPNAKYFISKKNFDWAAEPSVRDQASYVKENFMPLYDQGVLTFTDSTFFDAMFEIIPVEGHTFGQQLLKISDGSKTLLYCGDLIPTSAHIPLPYIMGYDLQPMVTLAEKKEILAKAAEEGWLLFFEHDAVTPIASVKKTEKGFSADQLFERLPDE